MNFRTPFRRTTAVVAGAFIGLAGAFAFMAPASAHTGELHSTAKCLDDGSGWQVTWTLDTVRTNGTTGVIIEKEYTNTPGGSELHTFVVGGHIVGDTTTSETQTYGNDVESAQLGFKLVWKDNGNWYKAKVWSDAKPESPCKPTPPSPSPSTPTPSPTVSTPAPGTPTPILQEDCTTMTIGLKNPAEGNTVTLVFETKKGEKRTTVIKPGETKTEKFSATPGFWVKVTPHGIEGAQPETIEYQQPADCDTAGSGGGLPVTGAAASTIAGGAAVLLAVGAVLFVMARRRKVKFTA